MRLQEEPTLLHNNTYLYIDCHVRCEKNCTESQSVRTGFENLMDGSYGAVATCSEEIMDSGHIFAVEV